WNELGVNNGGSSVYQEAVTRATLNDNGTMKTSVITGHLFVPRTPENFLHDADGNLIRDGHWTNTWDGENRLRTIETLNSVPDAAKQKTEYVYDYKGRRAQKRVYS